MLLVTLSSILPSKQEKSRMDLLQEKLCFFENILDVLLSGSERDEFNVKVRFEHLLLILLNLAALL